MSIGHEDGDEDGDGDTGGDEEAGDEQTKHCPPFFKDLPCQLVHLYVVSRKQTILLKTKNPIPQWGGNTLSSSSRCVAYWQSKLAAVYNMTVPRLALEHTALRPAPNCISIVFVSYLCIVFVYCILCCICIDSVLYL